MNNEIDKKGLKIIALSILFVAIVIAMVFVIKIFAFPKKEEPTPWYHDYENLEYILKDERSDEKTISFSGEVSAHPERIEFNYVYYEGNVGEFIPRITIKHKGVIKESYAEISERTAYNFTTDGVDYSSGHFANYVSGIGYFRVLMEVYRSENDSQNTQNLIKGYYIYINIRRS